MPDQLDDPLPWVKWYFRDWRADERLQRCSLAARGLWKELLCLMSKGMPYGHLVIDGKAPDTKELAVLVSAPPREVQRCLDELIARGVPSQTSDGVLYSRRLVRDRRRSERNTANGRNGGSPRLTETDIGVRHSRLTENPQNGAESVNRPMSLSDKARAQRAPVPEGEGDPEPEGDPDLPPGFEDLNPPEGAQTAPPPGHAPKLNLQSPSAPKPAANGASAAEKAELTKFMSAYAECYAAHRRQQYGRPEAREWRHAKAMLAAYGYDRLWTMSQRFIAETSQEYPFNGARTITELFAHRRLIEGRLIELRVLSPSAPGASEHRNGA